MVFNFAFNVSQTIQTFTTIFDHITIQPNQAVDSTLICGATTDVLQSINSFLDFLDKHKIKRFHIQRTNALGDILMLVPVVRALREQGYNPYIRTVQRAQPILDLLEIEVSIKSRDLLPAREYGIILDGTLEQDHIRPELSRLHRVDIYFEALGVQDVPKKLDWSMDLEKLPKADMENDYIVFQSRGSTNKKQLPIETRDYIVKAFEEANVSVAQISEDKRMSLEKLFGLIAGAKCLVCMDSSPLWISHFTRTPVVVLFGPTQSAQRIVYHPLYPKGAIGVALNKEVDCQSCFEQALQCDNRMDCLNIRSEKVFELIYPEVKRIVES